MDSAYNNKTNDESKIVRLKSTTGVHRTPPPHASNGDILDMNNAKLSRGEFWMPYRSWVNTFTHLEVVHLDGDTSRDEPSLQDKVPWVVRLYQGQWRKGVTAGGCRNFTGTFARSFNRTDGLTSPHLAGESGLNPEMPLAQISNSILAGPNYEYVVVFYQNAACLACMVFEF